MLDDLRARLPEFGYNDYLRHLPEAEAEAKRAGRPLRVAMLRSYTSEPIEPVLRLRLILEGYQPEFFTGGYNQYPQEMLDPQGPLHRFRPDLILLLLRVEEVMPDLIDEFPSRPASEWAERITAKVHELADLIASVERSCQAQVIVQNLSLPQGGYFGIYDAQHPDGQVYLVESFNRELAAALSDRRSVFIWDFDGLVRSLGHEQLYDPKMWYVSRNPYRQSSYPALVQDLIRYIRSAFGRIRKCVVLDLDNTLWGGIVGEDGFDGIRLGHTYPGNCFRDFQKELLKLYHRGILLAINSKNNEADALEVIDKHPDMVLRRQHFAAMRINWQDKASNLRELARELNIGLDSFIMIDDNPVECELLRQECADVDVVLLPDKPWLIPRVPGRLDAVENARLTDEDRRKGDLYRVRAERRELEQRHTNLGDFLQSLQVEVTIEEANGFSIPRIAQLTQKTNQMNVTTRRYTEAQIQAFASDPAWAVFSVASRDRFGDDGIVGVVILELGRDDCRIDTLLLSCRVIGRGIEDAMLAHVADVSRARERHRLVGEFLPTAKNQPAAGLYERLGFNRLDDTRYELDLHETTLAYPAHLRVTTAAAQ